MGIGTEAGRGTGSTWRPSLGEAPAPAHWLNLPRLTQPLPGMGGGVVHEGRGKSGQGWGVGGGKKGRVLARETGWARSFHQRGVSPPPPKHYSEREETKKARRRDRWG